MNESWSASDHTWWIRQPGYGETSAAHIRSLHARIAQLEAQAVDDQKHLTRVVGERVDAVARAGIETRRAERAEKDAIEAEARLVTLTDALRETDDVLEVAISELGKQGDKDFFVEERVEDAREVFRVRLGKNRAALLSSGVDEEGT